MIFGKVEPVCTPRQRRCGARSEHSILPLMAGEVTGALVFLSRTDRYQERTISDVGTQRYQRRGRFSPVLGPKLWVLAHGSGVWAPEI